MAEALFNMLSHGGKWIAESAREILDAPVRRARLAGPNWADLARIVVSEHSPAVEIPAFWSTSIVIGFTRPFGKLPAENALKRPFPA